MEAFFKTRLIAMTLLSFLVVPAVSRAVCSEALTSIAKSSPPVQSFVEVISYYHSHAGASESRLILESILKSSHVSNPFLNYSDHPRFINTVAILVSAGLDRLVPGLSESDWVQIKTELQSLSREWAGQQDDRKQKSEATRNVLNPQVVDSDLVLPESINGQLTAHQVGNKSYLAVTTDRPRKILYLIERVDNRLKVYKKYRLPKRVTRVEWLQARNRHFLWGSTTRGAGVLLEFLGDQYEEPIVPIKVGEPIHSVSGFVHDRGHDYLVAGASGEVILFELSDVSLLKRDRLPVFKSNGSSHQYRIDRLNSAVQNGRFFFATVKGRMAAVFEVLDGRFRSILDKQVLNHRQENTGASSLMAIGKSLVLSVQTTDYAPMIRKISTIEIDILGHRPINVENFALPTRGSYHIESHQSDIGARWAAAIHADGTRSDAVGLYGWRNGHIVQLSQRSAQGDVTSEIKFIDGDSRHFVGFAQDIKYVILEDVDGDFLDVSQFDLLQTVVKSTSFVDGSGAYIVASDTDNRLYLIELMREFAK